MKTTGRKLKSLLPIVLLILPFWIGYHCKQGYIFVEKFDIFFTSLLALLSSMVGFQSASLLFLIGFSNSDAGRVLRKNEVWEELLFYMVLPIIVGLAGVVVIIGIIFITDRNNMISYFYFSLVLVLVVLFFIYFILDLWILFKFSKGNEKIAENKEETIPTKDVDSTEFIRIPHKDE